MTLEEFWASVNIVGDCWVWNRAVNCDGIHGYGYVSFEGQFYRAHILAYMLHNRLSTRPTLFVLHKCDNPRCINPEHLFLGTQEDNMRDKVSKGRWRGPGTTRCDFKPGSYSDVRRAKLTEGAARRRAAKRNPRM